MNRLPAGIAFCFARPSYSEVPHECVGHLWLGSRWNTRGPRFGCSLMADLPLITHSLAEAYLYLMATPCASCREGPLEGAEANLIEKDDAKAVFSIEVTCGACGALTTLTFQQPDGSTENAGAGSTVINPTDEPSNIVDVAQWITLSHVILEDAKRETDRVKARQLSLQAARCIDEALKFYDDVGNDLPPPEAFYLKASRRGFRGHPEEFSKQRLINLKSKLPTPSAGEGGTPSVDPKAPSRWWRKRP